MRRALNEKRDPQRYDLLFLIAVTFVPCRPVAFVLRAIKGVCTTTLDNSATAVVDCYVICCCCTITLRPVGSVGSWTSQVGMKVYFELTGVSAGLLLA